MNLKSMNLNLRQQTLDQAVNAGQQLGIHHATQLMQQGVPASEALQTVLVTMLQRAGATPALAMDLAKEMAPFVHRGVQLEMNQQQLIEFFRRIAEQNPSIRAKLEALDKSA